MWYIGVDIDMHAAEAVYISVHRRSCAVDVYLDIPASGVYTYEDIYIRCPICDLYANRYIYNIYIVYYIHMFN